MHSIFVSESKVPHKSIFHQAKMATAPFPAGTSWHHIVSTGQCKTPYSTVHHQLPSGAGHWRHPMVCMLSWPQSHWASVGWTWQTGEIKGTASYQSANIDPSSAGGMDRTSPGLRQTTCPKHASEMPGMCPGTRRTYTLLNIVVCVWFISSFDIDFCVKHGRLILLHFVTFDSVTKMLYMPFYFFVIKIITSCWVCD